MPRQLENMLAALFDYFRENRELMRISFATMFAAPGEVPEDLSCAEKCERNFEFVHSLIKRAQKNGELDDGFRAANWPSAFTAWTTFYLVAPGHARIARRTGWPPKKIVELFLAGAGRSRKRKN